MSSEILIFVGMIFFMVFLLLTGLTMPVFGESGKARKRLRSKVRDLRDSDSNSDIAIDLRKDELKGLSDWEKELESMPSLASLRQTIAQSGNTIAAYRLILLSLMLGLAAAIIVWVFTHLFIGAVFIALLVASIPYLKIVSDRSKRLARFEEQLPDAIDVVKRALQAGHPFNESLHLVAQELEDPVAAEFGKTFAELNYGNDARRALMGLLERVPSVNVMAMVTSVLVQRETGGNLAEVLEKLSRLIRERFKFQRKVKTLSAEGRLSAWILCSVPFVLIAVMWLMTPDYIDMLTKNPTGKDLLLASGIGMTIGIYWISRIIKIEV